MDKWDFWIAALIACCGYAHIENTLIRIRLDIARMESKIADLRR